MKQEYNSFFDKITSERSDRQLLDGAIREAEKRMNKKKNTKKALLIPIAAALSLVVGAVGVGAAFGYEHLTTLFGGNESLLTEIQSNVFEDSDGHVSVAIEQLVSDGRHVHAAVSYTAIDDVGIEWLSGQSFKNEEFHCSVLELTHRGGVNTPDDKTWQYGSIEVDELRTETRRCFYSIAGFADDVWYDDNLCATFTYPVVGGFRSAQIDVTSTMETKRYRVEGTERCSDYLTPTYLDISALSYALYARDDYGMIEREELPNGGYQLNRTVPNDELEKNVELVLDNGERITLLQSRMGYCEPSEDNGYSDFIWGTEQVFDTDSSLWHDFYHDFNVEFDFDGVAGIEIGGVYYDLIAE